MNQKLIRAPWSDILPNAGAAEELLLNALHEALHELGPDEHVMLKLTLPELEDLYASCVAHPNVVRARRRAEIEESFLSRQLSSARVGE